MQLELVIHMFNQKFFTLQKFPFGVVIQNWRDNKIQYSAKSWGSTTPTNLQVVFVSCLLPIFYLFIY
jgi:hypothetical protein